MSQANPTDVAPAVPRGGWAVFALLLAGLGAALAGAHRVREPRFELPPLVVANPAKLDFGERWEGETFTWAVPIRNTTDRAVWVERFETTCDCASVEPKQLRLDAGRTEEVRLQIVPGPNRGAGREGRVQVVSLVGYGADRQAVLLAAQVRGRPTRLLDLDPAAVAVRGPVVRGRTSGPTHVRAVPRFPTKSVRVETDPDVQAAVRPGGSGYDVTVWVEPKETGPWSRNVRLVCDGPDGRVIGHSVIPVTAEVVDPVVAVPSHFHFGVVPAGETCEARIALTPVIDGNFVVEGWSTTAPLEVVSAGDRAYTVRLSARPGDQSARVSFRVRGPGADRFQVHTTLTAYGRP